MNRGRTASVQVAERRKEKIEMNASKMADTDEVLLGKINAALAEFIAASGRDPTAQSDAVLKSKSKLLARLLFAARQLHLEEADFKRFLKRVKTVKEILK